MKILKYKMPKSRTDNQWYYYFEENMVVFSQCLHIGVMSSSIYIYGKKSPFSPGFDARCKAAKLILCMIFLSAFFL